MVGQVPTILKAAALVVVVVAFQMFYTSSLVYNQQAEQTLQQKEFQRSMTTLYKQSMDQSAKIYEELDALKQQLRETSATITHMQKMLEEQKLSIPECVPACPPAPAPANSPSPSPSTSSSPFNSPSSPAKSADGLIHNSFLPGAAYAYKEEELASQAGRPLKVHPRVAHIMEKVQGMSADAPSKCGPETKVMKWHISIKSPNIGTLFGYIATTVVWGMFNDYQLIIPDNVNILPYFQPISRCSFNVTYNTVMDAGQTTQLNPQGKNARGGFAPGDCRVVYWYESPTNNSCFDQKLMDCELSTCKALPPAKDSGLSGLELASKELLWWRSNVLGWLFQPTQRVMDYINAEKTRIQLDKHTRKAGGKGVIGIHVRRGDKVHGGGGGKEDNISPLSDFFKSAEEFKTKYGVDTVYIISDDMKSIREEAKEFANSWNILYDDKTQSAGFFLSGDTAPDQVVMDSIRDAWLLSDCDFVVTKLTSFYSKLIVQLGVVKGNMVDFRSIDGNHYMLGEVSAPMFKWLNFMPL